MLKIVAVTALLFGSSPFIVAQVTSASDSPQTFVKQKGRNVTSIAKNQTYPLKVEFMRDPCANVLCYHI